MRFFSLIPPLTAIFAMNSCPPSNPPGTNPPALSWNVGPIDGKSTQTFGPNASTHIPGGSAYRLVFLANAPGGMSSMSLAAAGSPVCGADNGSGGIFTIGNVPVSWPTQTANFNPSVSGNSLILLSSGSASFTFFSIDCHATVVTDHGTKEAFAQSGAITLSGTVTDTGGHVFSGQLQVIVP